MNANEYLKRPYARRLTPDESGGFVASIQEFPGLVAEGDDPSSAYANLESAAESWIEAALEMGSEIPEPIALSGYSGKVALRIPRSLHKQAAEMASVEGTSLNQLLVSAIAHYLGTKSVATTFSTTPQITGRESLHFDTLVWGRLGNVCRLGNVSYKPFFSAHSSYDLVSAPSENIIVTEFPKATITPFPTRGKGILAKTG